MAILQDYRGANHPDADNLFTTDSHWLEEIHGIRFQEIDYSTIKDSPDHPCQSFSKVSDVCVVDANHQQRILMLATRALLPRRRFALSHLLRVWAHKNHVAGRILPWVRAAVRWWRGAFAYYR